MNLRSVFEELVGAGHHRPDPQVGNRKKPHRFRQMRELCTERCRWWKEIGNLADDPVDAHVGVLVTPWIATAVPFFSIECAQMLAHAGHRVTLIWDSCEITGHVPNKKHVQEIAKVFPEMPPSVEVVDLATLEPDEAVSDRELSRAIVYENAVRRMRGESTVEEFIGGHPEAETETRVHLGRIRRLLSADQFQWILIPGGIFGISGVYVSVARSLGLRFSTYDSDAGLLRLVHNGVAAHLADLVPVVATLREELAPEQRSAMIEAAREDLESRLAATHQRGFQVVAAMNATAAARAGAGTAAAGQPPPAVPCDILMPLNIQADSAVLARQRLFSSVEESIAAVLDHAPEDAAICIRQHPNERHDGSRSRDEFRALSARFSASHPRRQGSVRWIAAADSVSTYDLMRAARVILPHTSIIGVEAAMLGRPVVLSWKVYYEEFPFVWKAGSRGEFFALVEKAFAGELAVEPAARDEAAVVYYLTQQCALTATVFTPCPDDYLQWAAIPPRQLWERPEPQDFREALLTREPLTLIRHRRLAAAAAAASAA